MNESLNATLPDTAGVAAQIKPFDLAAVITGLFVYPVKSCAGVRLEQAMLLDTGLEFDRAWMVADGQGNFLTQRELPRMALVQPQLKTCEMILRAPGMLALHIALDQVEAPARVKIWNEDVAAFDMERFRPNIDPATAVSSTEVGDTLQSYRQNARLQGAVTFGMNAIVLEGIDHLLRVGQPVGANYRFE